MEDILIAKRPESPVGTRYEGCPILIGRVPWWLAYRTRNINSNNYSALLLGLKANLFCTNRTIGMTSFSISINCTIRTNGPSELTNHIRFGYIGH